MTIAKVAKALAALGNLLESVSAKSEASGIHKLTQFLLAHQKLTTATLVKKAARVDGLPSSWTGQKVRDVVPPLERYCALLNEIGGKSLSKELEQLVSILSSCQDSDLDAFIGAVQERLAAPPPKPKKTKSSSLPNMQLVESYVVRLKSAVGKDKEFSSLHDTLKSDRSVRKQEMYEIALRFVPELQASSTKAQALKAIKEVHLAASGFDRKLKAMGGRTAA